METLLAQIKIKIHDSIYLKEPESSVLGKSIITHSILLIHELGFEQFTLKKLADSIGTTESSIYRYFENKHKILLYLTAWYWGLVEYRLVFSTTNVVSSEEKLKKALEVLISPISDLAHYQFINTAILQKIIIEEASKTYLTRQVDEENENGFFSVYIRICNRINSFIHSINPAYIYSKSLTSLLVEGVLRQQYYTEHLPDLTDAISQEDLVNFSYELILKTIKH